VSGDPLLSLGLVELADAIARGEQSSETVTRHCLERMDRIGPRLNCCVAIDGESALEAARDADLRRARGERLGPLGGVPMAHKDIFYRAGKACAGGSKIRRDFVPDHTATVLSRLRSAGALNLGTLVMSEFALSPTGYNEHYGHCRNPWHVDYCSGGSSSGSGASVAARLVYGSLGTDSGGSIRHPAAMCGITGLKPTYGRVSRTGVMPLAWSLGLWRRMPAIARGCWHSLPGSIRPTDMRAQSPSPTTKRPSAATSAGCVSPFRTATTMNSSRRR